MTITINEMVARLLKLVELGHGGKPIYIWKPGEWMYPALPVVPPGQNFFAMIEANVCTGPQRRGEVLTFEKDRKR
jgi:hypothetical protein